MLASERRIHITNRIVKNKIVHVHTLAHEMNVSEMTIRRDLNGMERDGILHRTHGGAMFNEEFSVIIDYQRKSNENIDLKMKLAEYATTLVRDGQTIAINTSTITANIAKFILEKKVTLITNSLEVANTVSYSKTINLIITGGTFVRKYRSFEGSQTINDFSNYTYDIAFIGTNGIDENGIYTGALIESESKKVIINNAKACFVMAEPSKFGIKGQHKISELNNPTIITAFDPSINPEVYQNIQFIK